jgi:hypothetical protein
MESQYLCGVSGIHSPVNCRVDQGAQRWIHHAITNHSNLVDPLRLIHPTTPIRNTDE